MGRILSIDYGLLTSILWEIVRFQGTHIQNLEDRLTAIENKLSKMSIQMGSVVTIVCCSGSLGENKVDEDIEDKINVGEKNSKL